MGHLVLPWMHPHAQECPIAGTGRLPQRLPFSRQWSWEAGAPPHGVEHCTAWTTRGTVVWLGRLDSNQGMAESNPVAYHWLPPQIASRTQSRHGIATRSARSMRSVRHSASALQSDQSRPALPGSVEPQALGSRLVAPWRVGSRQSSNDPSTAEHPMTYRAPVADIAFALKHATGFGPALAAGATAISPRTWWMRCWRRRVGSRATCWRRSTRSATATARRCGTASSPRRRAGGRPIGIGRPGLERAGGAGAMGRPGAAASPQRGLPRNVERPAWRSHWAAPDHGGRRSARASRQRRTQAHLSAQARLRRMDGHDAAHRATGRLRRGCAAHQG